MNTKNKIGWALALLIIIGGYLVHPNRLSIYESLLITLRLSIAIGIVWFIMGLIMSKK